MEHRAAISASTGPRYAEAPARYAPTPVLYHGTRAAAARKILTEGFTRPARGSYTGHAVNLTESITIAYEYGCYEERGAILRVRLKPGIAWRDDQAPPDEFGRRTDALLDAGVFGALKTYGGNVWLTTPSAIADIELVRHEEAVGLLITAIAANGPNHGYNGLVQDFADFFHGQPSRDPGLDRTVKRMKLSPGKIPPAR
jgi:hypothetical protein